MNHTRQHTHLDTGWRFAQRDIPGAEVAAFDDADWHALDLPHDWSIAGPFSEDAPCGGGGGYLPGGAGWYRKRFALPAEDEGRRVMVQFDGVYKHADVLFLGFPVTLSVTLSATLPRN